MKVVYVGQFTEGVTVPYIEDNQRKEAVFTGRGAMLDLPDELAELLLPQRANYRKGPLKSLPEYAAIAAEVRALEEAEANPPTDPTPDPAPITPEG